MTMSDLATPWAEWYEQYGATAESINNFCIYYATSYEEYNAMWVLLSEMQEAEEVKK